MILLFVEYFWANVDKFLRPVWWISVKALIMSKNGEFEKLSGKIFSFRLKLPPKLF